MIAIVGGLKRGEREYLELLKTYNLKGKVYNTQCPNFCKKIKKAKNPIIIFGENILNQKNGFFLISKFKNLKVFDNKNINFFNTKTGFINFLEINFNNNYNIQNKLDNKNNQTLYLFNTNLKEKLKKKKEDFLIYQGHHFT